MQKLAVAIALLAASLDTNLLAQHPSVLIHPKPDDVASTLNALDVTYLAIDQSISGLSQQSDTSGVMTSFHERMTETRKIARQWAAIITISNGREMPPASVLFLLYTDSQTVQAFASDQTKDEKTTHLTGPQMQAAARAIRAETDLIFLTENLEYASADRIDAQEALCKVPGTSRKN